VPRDEVENAMKRVYLFRNRLAHHERVVHLALPSRHDLILRLAGWASPETRDWATGLSRVTTVLGQRPQP
jgi:hypothetical protein